MSAMVAQLFEWARSAFVLWRGERTVDARVEEGEFWLGLLRRVLQDSPDGNVLFSPAALGLQLGGLLEASQGANKLRLQEMVFPLQGGHEPFVRNGLKEVLRALATDEDQPSFALHHVSRLYTRQGLALHEELKDLLLQSYRTAVHDERLDDESFREMGKLLHLETHKRLPYRLPQLPEEPQVVLVSGLAACWQFAYPFRARKTQQRPFYSAAGLGHKEMPFLHKMDMHTYGEGFGARVLGLQYVNKPLAGYALYLFLPQQRYGLRAWLAGLSSADFWSLVTAAERKRVDVWLPRFRLSQQTDLRQALADLGLAWLFDSRPPPAHGPHDQSSEEESLNAQASEEQSQDAQASEEQSQDATTNPDDHTDDGGSTDDPTEVQVEVEDKTEAEDDATEEEEKSRTEETVSETVSEKSEERKEGVKAGLSAVIHGAALTMTETGTEPAPTPRRQVNRDGAYPLRIALEFRVDQPVLLALAAVKTRRLLFLGVLSDPQPF